MSRKADALMALQAALREPEAEVQLAPVLLQAEQYGWGQFTFSGTTFEDLRSTGNLRLIRDRRVRAALVDYYETWALEQGRIGSRRSNLPALVFKLLRIDFADADVGATVDEHRELDLRQLGDGVLPPLRPMINSEEFRLELQHELNYTDFVHAALSRLHQDARRLLQLLEGQ